MQLKYGLISVDDHVQEPPDLWTRSLATGGWGNRVPHIEQADDGAERWVADGRVLLHGRVASAGCLMPDRGQEPSCWTDVPTAAYVPVDRLKAMDAGRVDCSTLFPTVAGTAGETFGRLADPDLELACVRAYNDWLIEEWAAASDRFIPQCIVPIWPPTATVTEIRRAVGMGHRGVVFPGVPMELRDVPHIGEPDWDPVWAVCEELNVPLCLHAGGTPAIAYEPSPALAAAIDAVMMPLSSASLSALYLFSRVLLRHPRLRVVFAESALSWGVAYLEWADHQYRSDGLAREGYVQDGVEHAGYELKPSELFHRQCFFNGWFDDVAPFMDYLGTDHMLWSTNIPLATSTWPGVQGTIDRCFQGVPDEDRDRILWRNAAALYHLQIAEAAPDGALAARG